MHGVLYFLFSQNIFIDIRNIFSILEIPYIQYILDIRFLNNHNLLNWLKPLIQSGVSIQILMINDLKVSQADFYKYILMIVDNIRFCLQTQLIMRKMLQMNRCVV